VEAADRDPGDSIPMEIHLRQSLAYARLIGAKGAAALEQQRDTLEGRTGLHAARPISMSRFVIQQSLYWHERRSALVLDQEHQEFRRLGSACIPVNDMNIVRALTEGLSWYQCYLLSTLQLHHNGALQDVNKRMCIVSVDNARPPGACSTVTIR